MSSIRLVFLIVWGSSLPLLAELTESLGGWTRHGVQRAGSQPYRSRLTLSHAHGVYAVCFSPDGRLLASGCEDGAIHLWETATGRELCRLDGHKGGIKSVTFSPDGRLLVSASWDETACIWEVASGKELRRCVGHRYGISAVAFSPDGRLLATASSDCTMRLWDVDSTEELCQLDLTKEPVVSVAFAPDGGLLAAGDAAGTMVLWNVATGQEVRRIDDRTEAVFSLVFGPDGITLASGGSAGVVRLWDTNSAASIVATPCVYQEEGFRSPVMELACSRDGFFMATAQTNGSVYLWELVTGQPIVELGRHENKAKSVAFSADGKAIASGGKDGQVFLWTEPFESSTEQQSAARQSLEEDLPRAWDDLGSRNARIGRSALRAMVKGGEPTVGFLQQRLRARLTVDPRQIDQWIGDLDDERLIVRQIAIHHLQAAGEAAKPALSQALESRPTLEARRRMERLLDEARDPFLSPANLRNLRSIYVLEQIGSPGARRLLISFSEGDPNDRCACLARAAVKRLTKAGP